MTDSPGVYRVSRPADNYFLVHNSIARGSLRPRAKAVLLLLLSEAPGFVLTQEKISRDIGMGLGAIRAALGDLEEAGLLIRHEIRDEHGRITGTQYLVSDRPEDLQSLGSEIESREEEPGSIFEHTEIEHTKIEPLKKTNSSKKTKNPKNTNQGPDAADAPPSAEDEPRPSGQEDLFGGHDRPKTPREALDEEFTLWWQVWPKKVAKGAAQRAYRSARKVASAEALLAPLPALSERWARLPKDRRQYVVHPATWLNQHRWEDAPEDVIRLPEEGSPSAGGQNPAANGGYRAQMLREASEQRKREEEEHPERFSHSTVTDEQWAWATDYTDAF